MELWLIFAAIGVFVGGGAVYLAFMIFLPEWVGITGKTALETERSHRGDGAREMPVEVSAEVATEVYAEPPVEVPASGDPGDRTSKS